MEDALALLRGKPGEWVRLSVVRESLDQPLDVAVQRAVIQTETVLGDSRQADQRWNYFLPGGEGWGYLRVAPMFSERTSQELGEALEEFSRGGMRGLVLDLRGNPGGLLSAAVETCNLFLRQGLIVSTRGRERTPQQEFYADGEAAFAELPLAISVDGSSASASEIVAACLQDHRRGVVIGQRTFGKGSVQNLISLGSDGGALRLTTASHRRPSGRNIHRHRGDGPELEWGVRPNPGFEVALEGPALETWLRWRRQRDVVQRQSAAAKVSDAERLAGLLASDVALARGVEYLRLKVAGELPAEAESAAPELEPAEAEAR